MNNFFTIEKWKLARSRFRVSFLNWEKSRKQNRQTMRSLKYRKALNLNYILIKHRELLLSTYRALCFLRGTWIGILQACDYIKCGFPMNSRETFTKRDGADCVWLFPMHQTSRREPCRQPRMFFWIRIYLFFIDILFLHFSKAFRDACVTLFPYLRVISFFGLSFKWFHPITSLKRRFLVRNFLFVSPTRE